MCECECRQTQPTSLTSVSNSSIGHAGLAIRIVYVFEFFSLSFAVFNPLRAQQANTQHGSNRNNNKLSLFSVVPCLSVSIGIPLQSFGRDKRVGRSTASSGISVCEWWKILSWNVHIEPYGERFVCVCVECFGVKKKLPLHSCCECHSFYVSLFSAAKASTYTLHMSKNHGGKADSAEVKEENVKNQRKSLVIAICMKNTVLLIIESRLNEAFAFHEN